LDGTKIRPFWITGDSASIGLASADVLVVKAIVGTGTELKL
jgi:hypothetical protein